MRQSLKVLRCSSQFHRTPRDEQEHASGALPTPAIFIRTHHTHPSTQTTPTSPKNAQQFEVDLVDKDKKKNKLFCVLHNINQRWQHDGCDTDTRPTTNGRLEDPKSKQARREDDETKSDAKRHESASTVRLTRTWPMETDAEERTQKRATTWHERKYCASQHAQEVRREGLHGLQPSVAPSRLKRRSGRKPSLLGGS